MSLGHAIKYNKEINKFEFSEGYRYEDLTNENKNIIDWCKYLIDDIDGFKADYELETEEESILEKIKKEIALETIEELKEHLESTVIEYQVSLIENQQDE